ncbi:MAG TPA: hypothetical protein VNL14_15395 [Candidatus Acidoferrales bacterium]|nr:hypothetical protein [Candidatus Acidoferrales bacterium]
MYRSLGAVFLTLSLVLPGVASGAQKRDDWELLGRREVDFKVDRDRIDVGRSEGRFRQLRFTVKGGDIEMRDMVVTFGDGTTFSPNLRHHFDEKSSSRVIDLPGNRRVIKRVDFVYRSMSRRGGKATVSLYGR